jgi:hypothetical protein
VLHLLLHIAVPGLVAALLFRPQWARAWAVMLATMIVDVDHFLATPVFDPARCSIGYHPLHTVPAIAMYVALLLPKPTRLIGVGLLLHMALDGADCLV